MIAPRRPNVPGLLALALAMFAGLAAGLFAILLVVLNGFADYGYWVVPLIALWVAAFVVMVGVALRMGRRLAGR